MTDQPKPTSDVAVSAAEQAAEAAKVSASSAGSFAERAEKAANVSDALAETVIRAEKKIDENNRFLRNTTILSIAVNTFVLAILVYHGLTMSGQLRLTQEALEISKQQANAAIAAGQFSMLEKLRDDTEKVSTLIYEDDGAFAVSRETKCVPFPSLKDRDNAKAKKFFAHYELFYRAAERGLIPSAQWKRACVGAKDMFEEFCLLQELWDKAFKSNADQKFVTAFIPKCEVLE